MADSAAIVSDANLVDRFLDGEEAAARELFRAHQGRVQALLFRLLGSNRDVDDVLQETFIQVFRSLRHFRGEARLSTWIHRIAVRVAHRHLTRQRKLSFSPEVLAMARAETSQPLEWTIARDAVRRFYDALDGLSATVRVAFVLHELEGMPVADVAIALDASVSATKLRIWRARRTLHSRAKDDPLLSDFLHSDPGGDE